MIFEIASLVLLAAAFGVGWLWWQQQRRAARLANLVHALAGHADAATTPFELLQQAAGGFKQLTQGGDNSAGIFANMDSCPCRMTYTCASKIMPLNAWPNPNPNPVLGFPWNAPPREREPGPVRATASSCRSKSGAAGTWCRQPTALSR
jgi:hypothetical protein